MAQTWTAWYPSVALAAGKNMGAILNAHAVEILKIRRIGLLNVTQAVRVAGAICRVEVRRYTGATLPGVTAVVPVPHATANVAPLSATYGYAGAPAGVSSVLRRVFWSSDEPYVQSATNDEIQVIVPFNIIFDAGYEDLAVQPLTLRQDEMVSAYNTTGATGVMSTWIEFTKE